LTIICAKVYQNRLGFVDNVIKTFWFDVFFRFVVAVDVHLKNANVKFDMVV